MTAPPMNGPRKPADELDLLFAAAKVQGLTPSDALMARILADAALHQPGQTAPRTCAVAEQIGFWGRLAAALGGAGVLAGLGTAAVAGVMIGFAEPAALSMVTGGIYETTADAVDIVPSLDAFLTDG